MAIIQIPVLFDMSGDSIVFGEETTGDFVGSHLDFLLDMTTEANDISLNAADISSAILVGDQDTGDNIFYSGGSSGNIAVDNLCNRIAKAITRGKLVHTPKTGNSSNSGIPMGGRLYVVRADGQQELPPDGQYAEKYPHSISPIGDEQMLGEAMARVASVHLMGTPLPASILVDKNTVQNDLETASAQTFNSGNTAFYNSLAVQLSKVLGGSKSSAPMNSGFIVLESPTTHVEYTHIQKSNPNNSNTITIIDEDTNTSQDKVNMLLDGTFGYSVSWLTYDYFVQSTGELADDSNQGFGNVPVTTLGDSTTIRGPWFRVDLGAQLIVSKLALGGIEMGATYCSVKEGTLLGSNDDSTWTSVHTYTATTSEYFTGGTPSTDTSYLKLNEKTLSSPTTYRYWRFVITSIIGDPNLSAGYDHVRVSQFVLYDNNSNDITTLSFNGVTNPNTLIITASEDAGNNATGSGRTLQDNDFTTEWHLHSPSPFTTNSAGVTSISRGSTDLVGGGTLAGPWIGYDLGVATTSGKVGIALFSNISYENHDWAKSRAPKDITILGSSDDTNWNVVETITDIPILNYIEGGSYGGAIKLNEIEFTTSTYRYWRVSFQATHAPPSTGAGDQHLYLSELTFFKTDVGQQSSQGPLDASGTSVPALKSIYEQLMNVPGRSQIMQTRDVSGVVDNSNTTLTGGFPFISGDKLVMYLRPKIVFASQTQAENNNALYAFNYTGSTILGTPAYNIADKNGPITGQTYTQSSSQDNTNFIFEKATTGTGVAGNQYFTSAGNTYNNTTGIHEGANANGSTTNVDGGNTIAGEWGQVDIGESSWATELQLTTNNSYNDRSPREFRLLGSTDGTNWKTLIHQDEAGPWLDDTPQTFTISNPTSYRYYRYVVIKCYNAVNSGNIDLRTSIGHFNLRGVKYPSEVVEVTNAGLMNGSPLDISGLQTNVVASSANINDAFPGNATSGPEAEPSKWGWMGSTNSDSLSLDTTDVTDPRTMDLHIWKITITL